MARGGDWLILVVHMGGSCYTVVDAIEVDALKVTVKVTAQILPGKCKLSKS